MKIQAGKELILTLTLKPEEIELLRDSTYAFEAQGDKDEMGMLTLQLKIANAIFNAIGEQC